ncbi:MAG: FtsX-like permease family protein [Candidatus Saccharimonas sp.]|jgi:putative ABC transport system permease protein|nr:MAG: FtsX-like permease family protein [Candidatus Saccharimonas sp.]RYC74204.1 Macrolide export ATP-binding/permease protein MacB [Candidatus Nanosynsacchari sp. TM7_G1_3_12Alb]
MRLMTVEHITDAYQTLRRSRARTVLTALGIAIGVASVTCILTISDGARGMISSQVDTYDGKLMIVRPGTQTRDLNAYLNPAGQQLFGTSSLTEADIDAAKSIDGVGAVVPLMILNATAKTSRAEAANNVVLSTTPSFAKTADFKMSAGQFLGEETDDSVAVIGSELSAKLFNTDRSVGQMFTMHGQQFTVIGVVKSGANPVNYNTVDYGNAIFVSYNQGKLLHKGSTQIQQINVLAKDKDSAPAVKSKLKEKLLKQHLGEENFMILNGADIGRPAGELFSALTAVMAAIAAISLVVGGVGIMNIMLVGVAERTREIGIRKAVGASQRTIIGQFLVESLMISLLGGTCGYLAGYLLALIVSSQMSFAPTMTCSTAVAALLMAVGSGVIFGTYPALKAARKNTIESLRQYH